MSQIQLTLAIIKPHIIKQPLALKRIRLKILENDFKIILSKRIVLGQNLAERFYQEHKDKFFYNRLVTFMSSGASDVYILARHDAISHWRNLMGPTKVFRAMFSHPDSIRGCYGLSDTRNASHGSDSPQKVREEIGIFFPKFSVDDWMTQEEPYFRENKIRFLEEDFRHISLLQNVCAN